jgi:malate dehydrogenase
MNKKKVAVIGAGNVGAKTVYCLAEKNLADVVMVDVIEGFPQSKSRDFMDAAGLQQFGVQITGTTDYADIEGSDVVVLTAGIARKPGMDRMDLLKTNVGIAKNAAQNIARYAPQAVVIVVTNPLDIIAMVVLKESGFPKERVIGQAGVLDGTRFRTFIAEALDVWPGDVMAMVMGGHGDSMVPLVRYTSVGGVPLSQLLDEQTLSALVERTRKGGGEIVGYLKSGSAYYSPGASAAQMAESVLTGEKRLIAASIYLEGEYGYKNIFLGVPVIIGAGGLERILELELSAAEKKALDNSAQAVIEGVELLKTIYQPG